MIKLSTENKVKGLLLYVWRNIQKSISEHMSGFGSLLGGGFNSDKGRLMRGAQVFIAFFNIF